MSRYLLPVATLVSVVAICMHVLTRWLDFAGHTGRGPHGGFNALLDFADRWQPLGLLMKAAAVIVLLVTVAVTLQRIYARVVPPGTVAVTLQQIYARVVPSETFLSTFEKVLLNVVKTGSFMVWRLKCVLAWIAGRGPKRQPAPSPVAVGIPPARLARTLARLPRDTPWPQPRDGKDVAEEFLSRMGTHADVLPAWALLLRSPFDVKQEAGSWLGGTPSAPARFRWPRDVDGTPMRFLAQIDLAALRPVPETGQLPPSLPSSGALLVFFGKTYECMVFGDEDMLSATPIGLPTGIEPVRELGFFHEDATFVRWPIDIVPFMDDGHERPAAFPDPFADALSWIETWGVARLDGEILAEVLVRELRFAQGANPISDTAAASPSVPARSRQEELIRSRGAQLLAALESWLAIAASQEPGDLVDLPKLKELMVLRIALREELGRHALKLPLGGNAREVWARIASLHPELKWGRADSTLPQAYRSFVDRWIANYRRHKLFGLEPDLGANDEDRRGQNCVISINADELLGTLSEHEFGLSVWCSATDIAVGNFSKGQLIRHSSG